MNTYQFKISDKLRDPFLFEEILSAQNEIQTGSGVLNMEEVSFVEPYSMLALLLLGRDYLRSTGSRIELVNIRLPVHQYLNRMDFFKTNLFALQTELNPKYALNRKSFSTRVIEVIEIPGKERESLAVINSVIALFRKRASYILKYWMSESSVDDFVTVISELCQNIFEHSMDSGYLAMQTYTYGKENIFRLAIADSGVGIKESFAESKNDLPYATNADLIAAVLTKPVSSKRQFGFGLCQVNDIAKKNRGSIFIRSGDASVTALYRKEKSSSHPIFLKNNLPNFRGTQISVSLFA